MFPCSNTGSETCWAANKPGKVEGTEGDLLAESYCPLLKILHQNPPPEHHDAFSRSLGKSLIAAVPALSFGAGQEPRFLFCKILGFKKNKNGVDPYL